MTMRRVLLTAAALATFFVAAPALAQTATGNLAVSCDVSPSCTISAPVTGIAFGAYTGAVTDTNEDLTVTCNVTGYDVLVRVDNGLNGNRTMANGGSTLSYELYSDAYTTVWTAGNNVTLTTGVAGTASMTVYGRMPAAQLVAGADAGTFNDTVTMTVEF